MANTQDTFNGNGSNLGPFSFNFPWLESTDIKVSVDGVLKTAGTHYNLQALNYSSKNGGQVLFTAGNAPGIGTGNIRVYRDTDDEQLSATFYPGSAIRAQDLNDNFTQNLYITQEVVNNSVNVDGSNPMVADLDMGGYKIINLATPTASADAATKDYVDASSGNGGIPGHTRWRKLASAGQTVFSGTGDYGGVLSYSPVREQVYLNGALQQRNADYSADNGTSVTFNIALQLNDVVDVVCTNNLVSGTVSDAANINYSGQFIGQNTRTVAAKLADVVSVKDFGAVGDGVTDDTAAFVFACNAAKNVIIPSGNSLLINKTTLSNAGLKITLQGNAELVISNSDLTGNGLSLTGSNISIEGGTIRLSGAGYFAGFLVDLASTEGLLDGVTIRYASKASYTGDGVNIPYNTGVVRINGPRARVLRCDIYNGQGGGVWCYQADCEIANNLIHDNITGVVVSSANGNNCKITGNRIYDNNASTATLSGEDGILTYEGKGHVISNNFIWNSGEHGTYLQSAEDTITGNVVFSNFSSGIKLGGGYRSTVTGNTCYDNGIASIAIGGTDVAEIYIQSPFGDSIISSNKCSSSGGSRAIRCIWLESKAVAGREKRMSFVGNVISGTYSNQAMLVSGDSEFIISNNVVTGIIQLSQSSTNHPTMAKCVVADNVATKILIDKTTSPLIKGNRIDEIELTASSLAVMTNNLIAAQSVPIGLLSRIKEFSFNNVTYTASALNTPLFSQAAAAALNSNKRFVGNVFEATNSNRLIFFTSSGVSGNNNVFINNELEGAAQAIYTWGTGHLFIGNRGTSTGWIRGTNCIVTNNFNVLIEFPGSNSVANNL